MLEILKELNKEVGVYGSMVVTLDGIPVVSLLTTGYDEETVGAIASKMLSEIKNALNTLQITNVSQIILNATHGKIVFYNFEKGYLVVFLQKRINLDLTLVAISGAGHRLKKLGRINI